MQQFIPALMEYAAAKDDDRGFRLAAMGFRKDGAIVRSRNGHPKYWMQPTIQAHAETRLAKKLDVGSIVVVIRILANGKLAMAKPCHNCERVLRSRRVSKVIYSDDNGELQTMILD